jgi:hypothetical protein
VFGPKRENSRFEKIAENSELGVVRSACEIRVGTLERTEVLNRIDVHGIIKLNVYGSSVKRRTVFVWFRRRYSGGILENCNETLGS